jgi:hypothetical protein
VTGCFQVSPKGLNETNKETNNFKGSLTVLYRDSSFFPGKYWILALKLLALWLTLYINDR